MTTNIHFTKEDRAKALDTISELETQTGKSFDWKKLKRASGDELAELIRILSRQTINKPCCGSANGFHLTGCNQPN